MSDIKSKKILYTYTAQRSFVRNDIAILEKHFDVTQYLFETKNKFLTPISFIWQAIYLLTIGWKYKYFISFFAGYHSLLPSIFCYLTRKNNIIFLGGTDCFKYPSFNYGNFNKYLYGKSTCWSAKLSTMLVPVSNNLIRSKSDYYAIDSTEQGIFHWCPNLRTPYFVIPLEFNHQIFFRNNSTRKENSFITVAYGIEGSSYIRKGIDKVLMLAEHFHDASFTILGCTIEDFQSKAPPNVLIVGPVPYEKLIDYYNLHQFYLQLSIAEGFPSAICEAMLCECIPIGSEVAAIPEIINDSGFIIKTRDDKLIKDIVFNALNLRPQEKVMLGRSARHQIMANFGLSTRELELIKLINN